MIAITRSSSWTRVEGSSPATMRQKRHSGMRPVLHRRRYPLAVADVTVSIVAGGDGRLLEACLASLPSAARDTALRTVVVDNASSEPLAVPDGVELVRNDARKGFGANHNAVLAAAESRYALILNDDTVLDPEAIDRLKWFMDHNPAVGAAGPRLRFPTGASSRPRSGFRRRPASRSRSRRSSGRPGTCRAASASARSTGSTARR